MSRFAIALAFVLVTVASAQQPSQPAAPGRPAQTPRVVSPEVQGDQITFRFRDSNAREVMLSREGAQRVPMQRDENGVWSVTVGPVEPDLYGYSFVADGVSLMDPANPVIKPNLLNPSSVVHVPGDGLSWEIEDVPHGEVHHHFYRSQIVGDERDFFVYTPPGYDSGRSRYPVLYLLHGFSDDASGWTAVGRANFILDNLIAHGKAKPMIVVMPLGYGAPEILHRRPGAPADPDLGNRNMTKFREALLNEVLPEVERRYRVLTDRNSRAIAGLSMGGAESLYTGLNTLDRFAWIGGFSSGGLSDDNAKTFPNLTENANRQIRLLWIACGTEDRLVDSNRKLREWLTSKGVKHTDIETPGAHTWMVWRRNLTAFAPLLFQNSVTPSAP